jgi:hypothetical protein
MAETCRLLVVCDSASVEARVADELEALLPADGLMVEQRLLGLRSRGARLGLQRLLASACPGSLRVLLLRGAEALSRRRLARLSGLMTRLRAGVDWQVVTVKAPPGRHLRRRLLRRIERQWPPDLVVSIGCEYPTSAL